MERGDFYPEYEVASIDRSWTPGGEYFHTRVTSRVKELECFYEQITIAERERILRWLDRRTSGKLIFDERPYAAYFVRPTKKIEFKDQLQTEMGEKLYSGTFTITFTAYDPFAELLWDTIDGHEDNEQAIAETGLLASSQMPKLVAPSDTDCLIYNPGTEIGHSIIRFAGKTGSSNLEIYNAATGDKCVLKAGLETIGDEYYEIDSKTGRFLKVNGSVKNIDFAFHDEGYITFIPHDPILRDIPITTTNGSKSVKSSEPIFNASLIEKWIHIEDDWFYISDIVSEYEANINVPASKTATGIATIATMNYLTITKANDAEITRLEISCKAEVR